MLMALRGQRTRLDAAITALEALQPAPNGNGHKPPAGKPSRHYGKVSPEDWLKARGWWDNGLSADAIGERLKITGVSVHYHAKVYEWPKRKRSVRPVTEVRAKLAGRVRCQGCQQLTEYDPCVCGQAVAFK